MCQSERTCDVDILHDKVCVRPNAESIYTIQFVNWSRGVTSTIGAC